MVGVRLAPALDLVEPADFIFKVSYQVIVRLIWVLRFPVFDY